MSQDPEAVQTFQAITENYDEGTAIEYLTRHNWDVIGASSEYIANHAAVAQTAEQRVEAHAPAQADTRGWGRYIWDGVYWVGSSALGVVSKLIGSIFWPRHSQRDIPVPQGLEARVRSSCPNADLPPFETMGYDRASDAAMRNQQPLLLFLYTPTHSPEFLSEVLFSPAAASIMRENFTVALLNEGHPDFRALVERTQIEPPPVLIAVQAISRDQHAILSTLTERVSAAEVIEFLDRTLMQAEFVARESSSVSHASDPEKIIQDRLLRQEQEAAFREAERQAQEKERREQTERQQRQQEEAAREAAQQQKLREKEEKKAQLPPELPDSADTAKIAFRLPDGTKVQRNFLKTDTVGILYMFIDTLTVDLPVYELATSFPSHSLSDRSKTLESESLWPRAVLHVREVS